MACRLVEMPKTFRLLGGTLEEFQAMLADIEDSPEILLSELTGVGVGSIATSGREAISCAKDSSWAADWLDASNEET